MTATRPQNSPPNARMRSHSSSTPQPGIPRHPTPHSAMTFARRDSVTLPTSPLARTDNSPPPIRSRTAPNRTPLSFLSRDISSLSSKSEDLLHTPESSPTLADPSSQPKLARTLPGPLHKGATPPRRSPLHIKLPSSNMLTKTPSPRSARSTTSTHVPSILDGRSYLMDPPASPPVADPTAILRCAPGYMNARPIASPFTNLPDATGILENNGVD